MAESIERRRVLGYGAGTGVLALAGVAGALGSNPKPVTLAESWPKPASDLGGGPPYAGAAVPLTQRLEPPPPAFDLTPARDAVRRLLPAHADQIELTAVASADGVDRYRIASPARAEAYAVSVEGTSTSALLTGVGRYLKYVAGVTVSLPGDSLAQLAQRLPSPSTTIAGAAAVQHRFALNDTENGYAGAYRTWADWERLLDVLALHGFNEVLVAAGHDEVYRRVFAEFGYQSEELDAWIPAPAYQPWWLLSNLASAGTSGGAPGAPDASGAREAAVDLVRRIVTRLRELGLTPVLPGYAGQVPTDFTRSNPGAPVIVQGEWNGYQRPDWLDPRAPLYVRIAESFYRHQSDLYGTGNAFKMDLLHEGGNTGGIPMGDAAVAVMAALQTAHPGATWVMLGWQDNPRRDVLDALRACGPAVCATGRVLVVDGLSDVDAPRRDAGWSGTPYAFGTIPNFGGRSLLGANAATWVDRFPKDFADKTSALAGIAWLPEASGHDPAAFELFAELAWRPDAFDLGDWFDRYAARRYGRPDPVAAKAWRTFAHTAYSPLTPGTYSQAQDSLFCAWPDLSATTASPAGPTARYDPAAFQDAVLTLLTADSALHAADAYRYDVVDFTRQALANHARVLLPRIKEAYVARDLPAYRRLTTRWLDGMKLLDDLLATDERFLLGRWLGTGGYDARSLITTWGSRKASANLRNYGARELAGLVADLYLPRWRKHFADHETVVAGAVQDLPATDWYAFDDAWARAGTAYPAVPSGDPFAAANAVATFLGAS